MVQRERRALITGSSRGIGRGIALALADEGVKIAVHYFRNESAAKESLAQVRMRGSDGVVLQADVTDPSEITAMFGKLKAEFGTLDIFVSNARPEVPEFWITGQVIYVDGGASLMNPEVPPEIQIG